MWKEIFKTILAIICFIIFLVILNTVFFKSADLAAIGTAQINLEKFIGNLEQARTGQREVTLELPSIVEKIEIVPLDSSKGKYCLSQTCEKKCSESPYYIFITLSGKNNMACIEKELCCNVQFTEKTLLGTSTSNSIGGKILYVMQVSYDFEKQTFNAVVTSTKDKGWGENLNDLRRSILG